MKQFQSKILENADGIFRNGMIFALFYAYLLPILLYKYINKSNYIVLFLVVYGLSILINVFSTSFTVLFGVNLATSLLSIYYLSLFWNTLEDRVKLFITIGLVLFSFLFIRVNKNILDNEIEQFRSM